MKKRLTAIVVAGAMALALTACSGGSGNNGSDNSKTDSTAPAASGTDSSQVTVSGDGSQTTVDTSSAQQSVKSGNDLYDFYSALTDKMSDTVSELVNKHNESVGSDYTAMVNILYMPFSSIRFLDLAFFNGSSAETVKSSFKMLGNDDVEVTENSKNDYTIEYTATPVSSGKSYKSKTNIRIDPENLGVSIVFYRDGVLESFTDMQYIGSDRYALSTETDRAIVTYKDGNITEIFHAQNTYQPDYDKGGFTEDSFIYEYNDSSSVYGKKTVDESWVKEAESHNALYRLYEYKDGVMKITGLKEVYSYSNPITYEPGYAVTLP